jgi:hypothetical protein
MTKRHPRPTHDAPQTPKLTLRKETLRNLSAAQLRLVVGATYACGGGGVWTESR